MKRLSFCGLITWLSAGLFLSAPSALAVDGTVLINQNTSVNGLPNCAHPGFPVVICQTGSYRLSSNLLVPAGQTAIEIDADNVLLDLNGFTISGPGTCNGYPFGDNPKPATSCSGNSFLGYGVFCFGNNATVRNGSVRGMGSGVWGAALVEEVQATNNSIYGINAQFAIVRRCNADNNGSIGIQILGGVAEANEASLNLSDGIVGFEATVTGNALNHNGDAGLVASNGVLYGSNSIQGNAVTDIFITLNATVTLSQHNNVCTAGTC